MAKKYVLDGYTTPPGVTDTESVKKMQRMLGVTADGVWGPQSQRAYNANMDGISASHYSNNEKNARMRDVSPAYNFGGSQYRNILGISDSAFSGGDEYVGYTEYLNKRAEKAKSAAADEPVIKTTVIKKLAQEYGAQEKQDWAGYVSPYLPGASALGTGQNPWGSSMPYTQDPNDILEKRNAAQQAANGFGAFRLAAQLADAASASRADVKRAMDSNQASAQANGYSAGLMPVPQYGASGTPALSSFPANSASPQEILAEVDRQRQIANSMGAFRQAAQQADAESARKASVKRAMDSNQASAQANGYSAGLMPVPQYGASGTPALSNFPANSDSPQGILAEVDRKRQIANGMGAFRQAAQQADAESARRADVKRAMDGNQASAQANGYSAGLMPVPQYGQNPAAGSTPYDVYPVAPTLPWQPPDYSGPSHGGEPVDVGDALDVAEFIFDQNGMEAGQYFSKAGGEVLGTIGDIIGLVNFGSIVSEDLHDDGKIGIKTGAAVSGAIGSVVGNAIGTALIMLVGAGLGIATGGLAIPAFIGGLVVSGLGEKFATDMAMTAYDRFTNPDPERVAEQMENANYLMDDLAEYAKDNRISSSMPVPVFY